MKKLLLLIFAVCALLVLASCGHTHSGGERCEGPAICEVCGEQYGEALGHDIGYNADNTTHTKMCMRPGCGYKEGRASHFGGKATCGAQAVCVDCGFGYGDTPDHEFENATCTEYGQCKNCDATTTTLLAHNYQNATCTSKGTCTMCGAEGGNLLPHNYQGMTCSVLGTCTMCGESGGSLKSHYYDGETCAELGKCTMCGESGGDYSYNHDIPDGGNFCNTCGMDYFAATLSIKLNADGESYYIEGIGFCERMDIIIPTEYRGLPVTVIGDLAFHKAAITSVVIPDSIVSVNYGAFAECSSLTSVTISDKVQAIGQQAFVSCAFHEFDIPSSITELGAGAFAGCMNLRSAVIPESITILNGTFNYCSSLTKVTLHDKIEMIGPNTFYSTALTKFDLPDSLIYIGEYAFAYMPITEITLNDKIQYLGVGAFEGCALESITIPGALGSVPELLLYNCDSLVTVIVEEGITTIGRSAFNDCEILTNITLPSTLEVVYESFVGDCPNILFNTENGAYYLGNDENPYLVLVGGTCTELVINEATRIVPVGTFYNSPTLTSVFIGKNVEYIGNNAFAYCDQIVTFEVDPENELYASSGNCLIDKETKTVIRFYNTSVLPADGSATSMAPGIFNGLTKIQTIYIPSTYEKAYLTMQGCKNLRSVIIASGVKTIDVQLCLSNGTFKVYYEGTEAEWAEIDFNGEHVFDEKGNEYANQFVKALKYFYSETEPTEAGSYWHYVDGVPTAW